MESDRMRRLLFAWGAEYAYSSNRRAINQLTGQITCSPGAQLMKDTQNKAIELNINDNGSYRSEFSEECLTYVNQLVRTLPDRLRKIIEARYRWNEGLTTKAKCKKLHINRSTWYRRLDRAHQVLDECMDWRLTR